MSPTWTQPRMRFRLFNVFREDAPRDWFTAEQALSNAPRQANGLFIVPKVVE